MILTHLYLLGDFIMGFGFKVFWHRSYFISDSNFNCIFTNIIWITPSLYSLFKSLYQCNFYPNCDRWYFLCYLIFSLIFLLLSSLSKYIQSCKYLIFDSFITSFVYTHNIIIHIYCVAIKFRLKIMFVYLQHVIPFIYLLIFIMKFGT